MLFEIVWKFEQQTNIPDSYNKSKKHNQTTILFGENVTSDIDRNKLRK